MAELALFVAMLAPSASRPYPNGQGLPRRSAEAHGRCNAHDGVLPSRIGSAPMTSLDSPSDLPDTVERLAASVVGLATRRHRSSGVLWRNGVVVGSASALWRSSSVSLVLPDGEQVQGELRGIDGGTDLACVTFASGAMPVAGRAAAAVPRVGDLVFAVGRKPSSLTQASFGHV